VNLQIAAVLFDAREKVDQLWRLRDIPPFVRLTAQIVSFALLKCLQQGGWDVYFNPETDGCALKTIPPLELR
jgi:hypothetical protein